jgi:K+-transporting ATPase KdpF subunit
MLDLTFVMIAILFFLAGRLHMEYILALIVAAGVGVYLFYALLRPERF